PVFALECARFADPLLTPFAYQRKPPVLARAYIAVELASSRTRLATAGLLTRRYQQGMLLEAVKIALD
ncbi:MAG: hypothetical protein ACJ8DI_13835, partial [Ktedonobacteraceae bacterium]